MTVRNSSFVRKNKTNTNNRDKNAANNDFGSCAKILDGGIYLSH